jgi:glutaconate CoA-transferase subunit A
MAALQAGVMNVPFVPVRGLLGTDYMRVRPDFKEIANPYDPRERIALVPAIAPDVAVVHGWQGDRFGNVVANAAADARLIAQASRRVVATVEELVEDDLALQPVRGALVTGIHVTAVAPTPRGAHPTACHERYPVDREHLRRYMDAAGSDATFKAYLDRYVLGTRDHAEYLARVAADA